jgi:hypothetical protein
LVRTHAEAVPEQGAEEELNLTGDKLQKTGQTFNDEEIHDWYSS